MDVYRELMRRPLPAFLLLSSLAAAGARADDAKAVRLEYEAGAECPSREAFVEQVLRRSPGVRLAAEGEAAPEFRVVVVRGASESNARLTVRDGTAAPVVRDLAAPDCAELVASMVVVIALAIDARSSSELAPERSVPEVDPRSEGTKEATNESEPSSAPTAEATNPEPGAPPDEVETATNGQGPKLPVRGHPWLLGAGAAMVSDIAPEWSPGAFLFSDFGLVGDLRVRLSLGYATSGELSLDEATVHFSLFHGRAELCPVALQPSTAFALRPCAGLELGTHHAEGETSTRIEEPKSSSSLWLAGVLALRAELSVTHFLMIELEGQARFPFLHRTYVFERPDQVAYETPGVGAGVQLGLGFPLIR